MAVAVALLISGIVGASAASIDLGRNSVAAISSGVIEKVQYGGGYCQRLRYACVYKRRLGEEGSGNCERYRHECGGGGGVSHCERLRNACMYKESRGETGEGNCRRYREECRGR